MDIYVAQSVIELIAWTLVSFHICLLLAAFTSKGPSGSPSFVDRDRRRAQPRPTKSVSSEKRAA